MNTKNWLWPVPYTKELSGYYDNGHEGLDISANGIDGQNVYASKDGVVSNVFTGCKNHSGLTTGVDCNAGIGCSCNAIRSMTWEGKTRYFCNYTIGNAVFIKHTENNEVFYSQYEHLTNFYVQEGQTVKKGQLIGTIGSTGGSTGSHLHFSLATHNGNLFGNRQNNNPDVIEYKDSAEVTLDLNYSGSSPIMMAFAPGTTYGYLPTPSRSGYTFDGWYTERNGGSKFTTSTKVPNYPHSLYAHWSVTTPKVTVTFDLNYDGGGSTSAQCEPGKPYGSKMPTPSRTNYRFDGWYTEPGGNNRIPSTNIVHPYSYTLYAHWTFLPKVKFDNNYTGGGSTTVVCAAGEPYGSKMPTPSRTNYRFDGWFTNKEGGTQHTKDTKASGYPEYTLYAHWTYVTYVTFDLVYTDSGKVTLEFVPGEPYGSKMPTPSRSDFRFDGWFSGVDGNDQHTKDTNAKSYTAYTLYAHWTFLPKVKFDNNYTGGGSTTVVCAMGEPYGSKMPTPTRTGYTFTGWYTEPENGHQHTKDTNALGYPEYTLYAHWVKSSVYATFNANGGGEVEYYRKKYTPGKPYGTLPTACWCPECIFKGWKTARGIQITTSSIVPEEDHILYARWQISK